MLHDIAEVSLVERWDNGSKAEVSHFRNESGEDFIRKSYRPGQGAIFVRELMVLKYLGSRVSCVPRVLSYDLQRHVLYLEFVIGTRVLEWVLSKHGDKDVDLAAFKSFHGLETNLIVDRAFARFRKSSDNESTRLREEIGKAYKTLHTRHFVHGDPSPRNLLFTGTSVTLIDFDHSRPSLRPIAIDGVKLKRWYGHSG